MKKIILTFFLISVIFSMIGCQPTRVFVEADLTNAATQEFAFSEVLFFKTIDEDTAYELTGTRYRNSGILLGIQAGVEKIMFVPRIETDPLFLVDFPFPFSFSEIQETLSGLEDDEGAKLYVDISGDYGGLSISTGPMELLQEHNIGVFFTSDIIFTFTTMTATFYVASVGNQCKIFSGDYLILNE